MRTPDTWGPLCLSAITGLLLLMMMMMMMGSRRPRQPACTSEASSGSLASSPVSKVVTDQQQIVSARSNKGASLLFCHVPSEIVLFCVKFGCVSSNELISLRNLWTGSLCFCWFQESTNPSALSWKLVAMGGNVFVSSVAQRWLVASSHGSSRELSASLHLLVLVEIKVTGNAADLTGFRGANR